MAFLLENSWPRYQNFYLPLLRNHWLYIEKELKVVLFSLAWRNFEEILKFCWRFWSWSLSFQLKESVRHPVNGVFTRKRSAPLSKLSLELVKKSLMCGQNGWVYQAEDLRMGVNVWPKTCRWVIILINFTLEWVVFL